MIDQSLSRISLTFRAQLFAFLHYEIKTKIEQICDLGNTEK